MLLTFTSGVESFIQFITVLILFCFVLAITYFTSRWIAGYQKNRQEGSNITVIETCKVAPNKYIQIVKTGERYIVIAVCKDTITRLAELKEEELCLEEIPESKVPNFFEILEKAKERKQKK